MWSRRISGLLFCVPSVYGTVLQPFLLPFFYRFITVVHATQTERERNGNFSMTPTVYNIMEISFIYMYIVSTVVLERSGTTSAQYDFKQHCGKFFSKQFNYT